MAYRGEAAPTGRSTAGLNMLMVLVVLAILAVLAWFLFTGPLQMGGAGGDTEMNTNPPAQQAPAQPGGGTGGTDSPPAQPGGGGGPGY